jgi:hypothetical protein
MGEPPQVEGWIGSPRIEGQITSSIESCVVLPEMNDESVYFNDTLQVDDDVENISFNEIWRSTTTHCKSIPQPRIAARNEKKAEAHAFKCLKATSVATEIGIPMIVCVDGRFSSSGYLPQCGCNHCETCFHNNVLSLRKLMFSSDFQKNDGCEEG